MNFSETSPELDVNTLFSCLHSMLDLSRGLGVYPLPYPPPPPPGSPPQFSPDFIDPSLLLSNIQC